MALPAANPDGNTILYLVTCAPVAVMAFTVPTDPHPLHAVKMLAPSNASPNTATAAVLIE